MVAMTMVEVVVGCSGGGLDEWRGDGSSGVQVDGGKG